MKKIQQITSLDLSIYLKDLGIDHSKANLSWIKHDYQKKYHIGFTRYNGAGSIESINSLEQYPAFNSDELMEMLPCFVDIKKNEPFNNFYLEVHKRSEKNIQYCIKYICDTHGMDRYGNFAIFKFYKSNIYDEKLADALAKMLILLIDEKLYVKREPIDTGQLL